MSSDLKHTVTQLLAELDGPEAENAICTLRSLSEALPLVAEAYHREGDGRRRELLIHSLWQFRDPAALSTLEAALRDPDDRVWKEALDGLVTLGGDGALRVLGDARSALSKGSKPNMKQGWIDEAIQQIHENSDSG